MHTAFKSSVLLPSLLLGLSLPSPLYAQSIIATDGGGTNVQQFGSEYQIDGGIRNDANLFHSFDQLNLDAGETANFRSQPNIQNILGRISGGDPSIIDGLLRVSGGEANLYLMNPAGILFGENARLDIPGSFAATTATGIGFGDGWFNAVGENDYSTLVGSPTDFAFSTAQPGSIVNQANLSVNPGESLSLIAGNVVNVGQLEAPAGQIAIASVQGGERVRISQDGMLLSLEVSALDAGSSGGLNPLPFQPLDLPSLLTGTGTQLDHANQITVDADGTIRLGQGASRDIAANNAAGIAVLSGTTSVAGTTGQAGGQIAVEADRAAFPAGLIDISGELGGGRLEVYANQFTLGTAINAFGGSGSDSGGYVLLDPDVANVELADVPSIVTALGSGADVVIDAASTININAPINTSAQASTATLQLTDENADNNLTINLNQPITLGANQTLTGEGTTVNVTTGRVQNGIDVAAEGATVNLAAATYQESREIRIARSLTLQGQGADQTVLFGNNTHRVLFVDGSGGDVNVTLSNLAVTRGAAAEGAGIYNNQANLTIRNSRIENNRATVGTPLIRRGGGIFNNNSTSGSLLIEDSTIANNAVLGGNGTVSGQAGYGGGLFNQDGDLTIRRSTLSNNQVTGGNGGTFGGAGHGGALYNAASMQSNVTITDSTFSGNQAISGTGTSSTLGGYGGAIYNNDRLTLVNSTVTNNTASDTGALGGQGGGLYLGNFAETDIGNSIIAGNASNTSGVDVQGEVTEDLGANLIGNVDGSTGFTTSILLGSTANPLDPGLQPLGNYGGPTQTHRPRPDSIALDSGAVIAASSTDQRGQARIGGAGIDIGAVETSYDILATLGNGQSTVVNTNFGTNLQVQLTEAGQPAAIAGIPITFILPDAEVSGNFSGSRTATVNTDGSGVAIAPTLTASIRSGEFITTASSGNFTDQQFTLTNLADQPAQITILGGDGQATTVNTAFANALAIQVTDQFGNAVPNAAVAFVAPTVGASSLFNGNHAYQVFTNDNGVTSTLQPFANGTAGAYVVNVAVGELNEALFNLTNLAQLSNNPGSETPGGETPGGEPPSETPGGGIPGEIPGGGTGGNPIPNNPGENPVPGEKPVSGENPEPTNPPEVDIVVLDRDLFSDTNSQFDTVAVSCPAAIAVLEAEEVAEPEVDDQTILLLREADAQACSTEILGLEEVPEPLE
ncbi:MAG: two-partner secretion domain-containing protein [Thainema sp.]